MTGSHNDGEPPATASSQGAETDQCNLPDVPIPTVGELRRVWPEYEAAYRAQMLLAGPGSDGSTDAYSAAIEDQLQTKKDYLNHPLAEEVTGRIPNQGVSEARRVSCKYLVAGLSATSTPDMLKPVKQRAIDNNRKYPYWVLFDNGLSACVNFSAGVGLSTDPAQDAAKHLCPQYFQ